MKWDEGFVAVVILLTVIVEVAALVWVILMWLKVI